PHFKPFYLSVANPEVASKPRGRWFFGAIGTQKAEVVFAPGRGRQQNSGSEILEDPRSCRLKGKRLSRILDGGDESRLFRLLIRIGRGERTAVARWKSRLADEERLRSHDSACILQYGQGTLSCSVVME